MTPWRPRLGILLSGRGSNFEAIAANVLAGKLACDIGFVFSNKADAAGLTRARQLGLPCGAIASAGVDRASFDAQVARLLKDNGVDLVCLAGYMRLLSGGFVAEFPQRILEYSPIFVAGVSRIGCTASGFGSRCEVDRLHGAFGG